ncbi:MAG TPA: nucleotide pyrophosphohydrolase [Methylococcus sp.]|nr:nucleotide pyrophosphohydrolase [Methylococcus sp.]
MDVRKIQERLRDFAEARDWERFHTPKNLAMALAVEAAELLEHFQWLTAEESLALRGDAEALQAISEEIADVAIYLIRLADRLGVDLETAVSAKILLNEKKYPIDLARGNAVKYNRRKSP